MGLINDIFSSEGKTEEEEVEIGDFEEWLNGRVVEDIEEKYREVRETVDELEGNLEDLKEGEIPEEAHSRLKSAGETNKQVLVDRLENFIDNFDIPKNKDVSAAVKFLEEKSQELSNLSEKLRKNFMFLQKVQEDEAGDLLDSMKRLEKLLEEDRHLGERKSLLETSSELSRLRSKRKEGEREIESLEEELKKVEEEKEALEKKREEEVESRDRGKIDELEEKVEEIKREKKKKKNGILQRLSPLKRGLKKLSYLGFVPGDRQKLLQTYIDSPLEALKEDEGASFLGDVLEKLEELLEEEQLEFGKNEREKMKRDMEKIDPRKLNQLKDRWLELEDEIKEKEEKINKLEEQDRTKEIKTKIESEKKEISKIKRRLKSQEKELEAVEEKIREKKKELKDESKDILNVDLKLE